MPFAAANGISLEYESSGSGEPAVFIHGVLIADAFLPVTRQPALAGFRRITYVRRGYAGSDHPTGPTSVEEQAADCRALLSSLGIPRAHVVGHSYGGIIALQLALDAPEIVRSLSLMEPALIVGGSAQGYRDALAGTVLRAREAGPAVAIHEFLEVRSPGYRERLERTTPGAFEQAVAQAATTLDYELPSVLAWPFSEELARRIAVPTLAILGERSRQLSPRFEEAYRLLLEWLPDVEGIVIPGATHLMQSDNPAALAGAIASFVGKHPMAD